MPEHLLWQVLCRFMQLGLRDKAKEEMQRIKRVLHRRVAGERLSAEDGHPLEHRYADNAIASSSWLTYKAAIGRNELDVAATALLLVEKWSTWHPLDDSVC